MDAIKPPVSRRQSTAFFSKLTLQCAAVLLVIRFQWVMQQTPLPADSPSVLGDTQLGRAQAGLRLARVLLRPLLQVCALPACQCLCLKPNPQLCASQALAMPSATPMQEPKSQARRVFNQPGHRLSTCVAMLVSRRRFDHPKMMPHGNMRTDYAVTGVGVSSALFLSESCRGCAGNAAAAAAGNAAAAAAASKGAAAASAACEAAAAATVAGAVLTNALECKCHPGQTLTADWWRDASQHPVHSIASWSHILFCQTCGACERPGKHYTAVGLQGQENVIPLHIFCYSVVSADEREGGQCVQCQLRCSQKELFM